MIPVTEAVDPAHHVLPVSTHLKQYKGGKGDDSLAISNYNRDITPKLMEEDEEDSLPEMVHGVNVKDTSSSLDVAATPSDDGDDQDQEVEVRQQPEEEAEESAFGEVIMTIILPITSVLFASLCVIKVLMFVREDLLDVRNLNETAESLEIEGNDQSTSTNARNLREILVTVTYQRRAVLEKFFSDAMPFSTIKTKEDQDTSMKKDTSIPNDTGTDDGSQSEHDDENPSNMNCPNTLVSPNKTDNNLNEGTEHGIGDNTMICRPVTLPTLTDDNGIGIEEDEDRTCPICLDMCDEDDDEPIIQSKHCSHFFHKECILEWLEKHSDCPVCREHMITPQEVHAAAAILVENRKQNTVFNRLTQKLRNMQRSSSSV